MATSATNVYEQQARDAKCRKVVAYLIGHMAKMMANPSNADFWVDAARDAGVSELSEKSKQRALGMMDQIVGKLKREEKT
jgi:hypothetical protein